MKASTKLADVGRQPSVARSALTSVTDSAGDMHVYYFGSNNHVYELAWFGGSWHPRDVTGDAGGQLAVTGSVLTSIADGAGDMHVYYLSSNNHVCELAWFGGSWHPRDVAGDAGGQPAVAGSVLTSITDGAGDMHVYYLGSNNHVYELAWNSGCWNPRDVTGDAGGQLATSGSVLTSITDGAGDMHVYYLGSNNHVCELAWNSGCWNPRDLLRDWVRLNFSMQHQQQTQWCWAATACSISAFFNPNTQWIQCRLVNAELGRSDCCNNGSSNDCNKPWYLDKALTRTGNLQSFSAGAASIEDILKEIENGNPICVRIGWHGGGGHAVAIEGYNYDLNMVAVEDPWYGSSDVTLDTFKNAYKGSGTWTHRCYVKH